MAWDKNDYLAAALILSLVILAILVGLYLGGAWDPSVDKVFPFI